MDGRCGTAEGCQCDGCKNGECKVLREQHPLLNYNRLGDVVLCPPEVIPQSSEGQEEHNHKDHKRACVEGTCPDYCGIWDAEGNFNPKLWIMSCPLEVR